MLELGQKVEWKLKFMLATRYSWIIIKITKSLYCTNTVRTFYHIVNKVSFFIVGYSRKIRYLVSILVSIFAPLIFNFVTSEIMLKNIFNNPGLQHIAETIFCNLSYEDLEACRIVNQSCKQVLDDPMLWLKQFIRRGLSIKNQKSCV